MNRIDTASKAVDLFGAGKHGFKDGNIVGGIVATQLTAQWFNMFQETIARFIEGAGIALDAEDYDQLTAAFDAKLTAFLGGLGDIAFLDVEQLWTKAQGSAAVALADVSPVVIDTDLSNLYTLAPTASRLFGNCTNVVVGRPFVVLITQPVGGNCGLSFDTNWLFENDEAPANTTTPNAVDALIGIGLPAGKVFGHMKLNLQ